MEQKDGDYHNMGDHPSVIGYPNTGPAGSKGQNIVLGTQTGSDVTLSNCSTTSLRSDRLSVEKADGSREDALSVQRSRQQSNSLPLPPMGRATAQVNPIMTASGRGLQMISSGPLIPPGAPLSFASAQPNISSSLYMEALSLTIWQFYTSTRQSKAKYAKKVHLRNALLEVVSGVFKNAGLFIVGSSMNGFGSDQSDMDMCLTVTSQDLQQKKEAFAVLSQLLPPLRNCSFIRNLNLIRAKVPILKFRDTLAGVDCDLNVNNVVGIYNTHLLAMYTRIDWRVRPLGMFVKYWAQRMDIHDGSRGRLSTYPLLLMLIHYLQASCTPPILPNLQARFPKIFNYACPLSELDMRLELPWAELRSNNPASLAELFVGFIHYYTNEFDFSRWAISVRNGAPLPIDMAIRRLPPHEQAHTARSFKVFVEEPFCQSNAARSLYDDNVLSRIRQAFVKTHQALRAHRPLESIWVNATTEAI
ncbi:unnamed protein product [Echinostoma caproni]|uniref:PAP-associated domain-containing protein n=1 Tax=Echinostoma caproni TaxID=27848 RepID=A0A183ABZ4_9TREM|nr:unnamed protein product [Echinostoma caproni]